MRDRFKIIQGLQFSVIALTALLFVSCKETGQSSKISIKFERKEVGQTKNYLHFNTSRSLSVPATVSDFNCVFVNVMGNGIGEWDANKSIVSDGPYSYFSKFTTMLNATEGGTLSLSIPSGSGRIVQIIGVVTSLPCSTVATAEGLLNTTSYPVLFEISRKVTDIFSSSAIEMTISYNASTAVDVRHGVSVSYPTVTYDGNGSNGGSVPVDARSPYLTGATVTVKGNTGTLTKTGYTFARWNTVATGSGTSYSTGDTFTLGTASVTLYAQWSINSYTVTYDANGGTGSVPSTTTHEYNSSVSAQGSAMGLERTGYTYAGWNTAADGSGTSYSVGETFTMGAANVTLYAKWLTGESWSATETTASPLARRDHTAVWTGSKMIVFGGGDSSGTELNTGGQFDPVASSWSSLTTTSAPAIRKSHTVVWTGSKMIVFGGYKSTVPHYHNTGGQYDPVANTWSDTTTTNAPDTRYQHTSVWEGSKMIVFGGDAGGSVTNTGAKYDPIANNWYATETTGAPATRYLHTAVWIGSKMVVFGGSQINTGGQYDLSGNAWTATTTTGAPSARLSQTAVWTGSKMLVFGGSDSTDFNTGGQYDPFTNTWSTMSTLSAPSIRRYHSAVWTGVNMFVFGGLASGANENNGGLYDPVTNTWTATTTTSAPEIRHVHTAVWTGSKAIIFGGSAQNPFVNTGGIYTPPMNSASNTWTVLSTTGAPSIRNGHSAVWTGSKMIVWGGTGDSNDLITGGQFDAVSNSWTSTFTTTAPGARHSHSVVWTGSKMIVWGGFAGGFISTGSRYDPVNNVWSDTTTYAAPSARYKHNAIWSGSKMIVLGGSADAGAHCLNTGAQYDPQADSWTLTESIGAPSISSVYSTVWTGSKLIAWGGCGNGFHSNSGGLYDPNTNAWTIMSTTSAPSERQANSAVWSGAKMIVFGGNYTTTLLNTGGRYDPFTNTWGDLPTTNAPVARNIQTAVWTGARMLIYGGAISISSFLTSGGLYDPAANSWTTTSTSGAPIARFQQSSVWADSKLLIFGGNIATVASPSNVNTGGAYTP